LQQNAIINAKHVKGILQIARHVLAILDH